MFIGCRPARRKKLKGLFYLGEGKGRKCPCFVHHSTRTLDARSVPRSDSSACTKWTAESQVIEPFVRSFMLPPLAPPDIFFALYVFRGAKRLIFCYNTSFILFLREDILECLAYIV